MSRHQESMNARKNHILPKSEIRPQNIKAFLDSQNLPESIRSVLDTATPATWLHAGRIGGNPVKYTTPLSPKKPVAHYDMKTAAMFILKNGVDKVNEMPTKIKEDREKKGSRNRGSMFKPLSHNPLDIFSDRRPNNG